MRRILACLGAVVLLLGSFAGQAGAVSSAYTVATWNALLGTSGYNGAATLTASSTGTGSLSLRARHLVGLGQYGITIRRGTCSAQGTLLATLPTTTAMKNAIITKTYPLTVTQMRPVLKAANSLTLWLVRGSTQRCGVLKARFPGAVVPINHRTLIPHTANGAVGMHWLTLITAETWEPTPGWDGVLEEGDVALAVHVRMSAVEKTNYGPAVFFIRTPGHVDIEPQSGREPGLPFGSLAPGRTADGWITFVVNEDELGELTLLYQPASGILLQFALS